MKRSAQPVTIVIFGLIAAFTAIASTVATWFWADLDMSVHGWVAYGFTCLFTVGLAGGLFCLLFKSSRDGYDDIDHHGQ